MLRDLTHISQASVETGADAEEEEQAYAEIVEYVRAGVQLIHDELLEVRVAGARKRPSILPASTDRTAKSGACAKTSSAAAAGN